MSEVSESLHIIINSTSFIHNCPIELLIYHCSLQITALTIRIMIIIYLQSQSLYQFFFFYVADIYLFVLLVGFMFFVYSLHRLLLWRELESVRTIFQLKLNISKHKKNKWNKMDPLCLDCDPHLKRTRMNQRLRFSFIVLRKCSAYSWSSDTLKWSVCHSAVISLWAGFIKETTIPVWWKGHSIN